MFALLSVLLLSSHVLPVIQSLTCNEETEYLEVSQCCKKCKPGQFLEQRCRTGSPDSQCLPCGSGFFMDKHNNNFRWCHDCTKCNKDHMKYKRNCTATSDAECTCDEGYKCSDLKCMICVKVQTTTPATFRPPSTPTKTAQDMHDHVDGSCQHRRVSGPTKRATLDISAQSKRMYQCQCRRCVEKQRNWRMSEKRGRRPLMRLRIEYLL